jgi:hypothetical protein
MSWRSCGYPFLYHYYWCSRNAAQPQCPSPPPSFAVIVAQTIASCIIGAKITQTLGFSCNNVALHFEGNRARYTIETTAVYAYFRRAWEDMLYLDPAQPQRLTLATARRLTVRATDSWASKSSSSFSLSPLLLLPTNTFPFQSTWGPWP